jgi:hypothetical protein
MPLLRGGRQLKRWRYFGVYGPDLMVCAGRAQVGLMRQAFWAVVEPGSPVRESTSVGGRGVRFDGSRCVIEGDGVHVDVLVDEGGGVECVNPHQGKGYIWTRKQAGVRVRGTASIDGRSVAIDSLGVVDDSAGYHARHTDWRWCAGVGSDGEGRRIGWNLVTGLHDGPTCSERSVWIDGEATEIGPVSFADDLSEVSGSGVALRFDEWPGSARVDDTNALIFRSSYRQPFGAFTGSLPGVELASGYGVMETHSVVW